MCVRKTYLIVESLEPLDPVHHWLQLDPFEVLIHPVDPLNSENVVAEVEALKPIRVLIFCQSDS